MSVNRSSSICNPSAKGVEAVASIKSLAIFNAIGAVLESDFICRAMFLSSASNPSGQVPAMIIGMFSSL
jgi:hypothetical protein